MDEMQHYRKIINGKYIPENDMVKLRTLSGQKTEPHTLEWYPTDTEDRFKSLSQEHQDAWKDKELTYKLNSYGMRCDEVVPDPDSIIFLGCSMTFGVGCPKESTWTHKVAKYFAFNEVNCGIPAGSLDACFRMYLKWQPFVKAKRTVLAVPPGYRFEKIIKLNEDRMYIQKLGVWDVEKTKTPVVGLDDINMYLNYNKNLSAIQHLAKQTGSDLIIVPWVSKEWILDELMLGRDQMHPSEEWHQTIADRVIKLFSNIDRTSHDKLYIE